MEEEKYIEGFNDGFLIATHRPELGADMVKAHQDGPFPYLDGLKDGIQEREQEREKERLDDLSSLRRQNKNRELDLDR